MTNLNHKIVDYYRKKVHHPIVLDNQSFTNSVEADGDWQENRKPKEWRDENEKHVLDNADF